MKRIIKPIIFLTVIGLLYGVYALFGARMQNAFNLRAAETALADGDLVRAAGLYAKVLETTPRDEELRLKACNLYRESGNFSRAEYLLFIGLRDIGPSVILYKELCALYVAQDKLYDAVDLLDTIRSPSARDAIEAERPAPPTFDPPEGAYGERFEVRLTAAGDCTVYASWTGDVPSVLSDRHDKPAALDPGVTRVKAVAVNSYGLVSEWIECEYILENIIDPVVFSDPAVETAIRSQIGQPDGLLYTSDLWGLTELSFPGALHYRTLDDLKYCPGLQSISLTGDNGSCDISVLPALSDLTALSLRSFGIDSMDLEEIGQCAKLEELYLAENKIGPLKPLEGLEHLTVLDLSANSVMDVSPLGNLMALRELRLAQNAVQDLSPLSALTGLRELYADENRLDSLRGVDKMTALEILDISHNPGLSNISEISGLTRLKQLAAAHCQIEKLPKIGKLQALEELYIYSNQIPDLEGLDGLTALSVLYCSENAITSLEPLSGITGLTDIDVSRNGVSSVEPLRGLPLLTTLRIEYNNLTTMLPLKDCPSLKTFFAFGNSLTDPFNAWDGTGITPNR